MKKPQSRMEQRIRGLKRLTEIAKIQENILVIHYSCESFHDRPNGASPRVTSIAIRNLATAKTTSFSIHKVAELKGQLSVTEIQKNYDVLEKQMLEDFYSFVSKHQSFTWVHWNMRDANYGFPALEHRLQVLKGTPVNISEEKCFDLGKTMKDLYGSNYAGHPRLTSLREMNDISDLDFLDGEAEAKAFKDGEFYKLHLSTLRKVDILASIFELTASSDLKTKAKKKEIYGSLPTYWFNLLRDHWLVWLLGVVGGVASIVGLILVINGS